MLSIPDDMKVPNLALIRVPSVLQAKDKLSLVQTLYQDYQIITAIENIGDSGLWLRISCNVYNTRGDYEKLAEAMLNLTKDPSRIRRLTE